MSDQTITLLILAASVVLFVSNRIPVGIVALGVALSLWATDILTLDQAIAGFGNQTVVLIAALFVVAEALDAAGVTVWAGQQVINHAGDSRARLIVLISLVVAILTALITPNGAVAALFPMVVVLAVRLGHAPSQLLMPVAFAAHAGALLVLTGSPVTLLVSDAIKETTGEGLGFFEVALVGVPILIGTVLVVVLFGQRLLPVREPSTLSRDLSALPAQLRQHYILDEQLARVRVGASTPFVGRIGSKVNFDEWPDLHLISIQDSSSRPISEKPVTVGDSLVLRGTMPAIERASRELDLAIDRPANDAPVTCGLISREFGVAEILIPPRSTYIGERVFPGMITQSGNLVVLGIQRLGEDIGTREVTLSAGDSLLMQGGWDVLDEYDDDPNVVVVDSPDAIRRQTVPLGPGARPALAVLAGMIVLLVSGVVPAMVACLLAAIAMVLLRVVTVDQAHRSMAWTTLILVAAMIPLSTAITQTGAAETLAELLVDVLGGSGPYPLIIGLFLLTAVLGQMISNTATALIMIPIAVSVAAEMDVSPVAILMSINVAAAAALLTPIATPANLMVMGPGGYSFADYPKLGLPLLLIYMLVGVGLVPLIWNL
jgi:di/tricarboxylate transporter